MNTKHAWDIYGQQLFHHGHGFPLWMPDPDPSAAEVRIGDVGWVKQGGFRQLFNTRDSANSQRVEYGVPSGFVPFNPPNLIISGPHERIVQPVLCSRTISQVDISGGASAGTSLPVSASGGANFSFKCNADSGAMLIFSPTGYSRDIESRRHIVNYMREHFDNWMEHANTAFGLDLKEEELFFVCGTTKTEKWAVAAFNGHYKRKSGSVTADLGSLASLNLAITISNEDIPNTHYRVGPRRNSIVSRGAISHGSEDVQSPSRAEVGGADQCIFIHYYKAKRRLWYLREMKAAAGPHELPPPGPDEVEEDSISVVHDSEDFEGGSSKSDRRFDPVNDLLDYVLQNSEAKIAVASDRDVYALFKDQEFPEDVAVALQELQPTIDIDEYEVGTISVTLSDIMRSTAVDETALDETRIQPPVGPAEDAHDDTPATRDNNDDADSAVKPRYGGMGHASVHDGSVTALAYSPDGKFAASGSEDTTIIIWDVRGTTARHHLTEHRDTISSLAFSYNNDVLASGSNDGKVLLWNVATGDLRKILLTDVPAHSVAFSPDGSKLIVGAYEGSLYFWDTETYEDQHVIKQHMAVVTFVVFSKDGRFMATGGTECECFIWNLATLESETQQSVLKGHTGMVCAASFSPDGRRIATASDDGSCRIWNAESGDELVILHEHSGPVWSVAFSPDNKHIASGSSDSSVKINDSYSGELVRSLEGHDSMINAVEFSPDGKYIASAASDNTVRLWDSADGQTLLTFNEHSDNVTMVLFSPDGATLTSGSHDGTVWIRPVEIPVS